MPLKPKEIVTTIILVTGSLAFSWFFWFSWNKVLVNPLSIMLGNSELLPLLLYALLSLLIYLSLLCLVSILLPHLGLRFLVVGISAVSLALVFYQMESLFLLVSFVLVFLGLAIFVWQAKTEIDTHLKMRLGHIFSPVLSTLLLFLIIVMSMQTFAISQKANADIKIKIPDEVFNQILEKVGGLGGLSGLSGEGQSGFFGGQVKGTTNVDLQAILEGRAPLPPEVRPYFEKGKLPPEVMAQLRQQGVSEEMVRSLLSGLMVDKNGYLRPKGGEIEDKKPEAGNLKTLFSSQLKTEVENQLNSLLAPFKKYLPIILAASVFLTLLTIKGILASLVILSFSAFISLLKLIKVIRLEKKEVEAERLAV